MPLIKSGSKAAVRTNISEMVHSGYPQKQAVAAAYSTARKYGRKRADGGKVGKTGRDRPFLSESDIDPPPPFARGGFADGGPPWTSRIEARGLSHSGMIHSPVPGRTDKLPISVKGGAYILPADHVSAVGQGNSAAGANIINSMFKMGPSGGNPLAGMNTNLRAARTNPPKLGRLTRARGGAAHDGRDVPIIAAGGEFAIPPDKVAEIGGGDIDRGHKILDHWVMSTRKTHIKTLRGLKPPKK